MASCSRDLNSCEGIPLDKCRLGPIRAIRAVLVDISNDDALTTGSVGTKLCLTYAEALSKQLISPTIQDEAFAKWLHKGLVDIMQNGDRTELWKQFYGLRSSNEFCKKWEEYLDHLDLSNEPLFYQHLTLALFEQILSDTFKDDPCPSETSSTEFTYEEENAIRYMGGYVIRKLKEKDLDVGFLEDSDKYLESQSSDWINAIDCGGLVHITDSCFQLFLAIETITRQEMKATAAVMDDSFRSHLENMITSDSDVLFCWTLITGEESLNENILHEVIQLWVTIRGFSFAKSIVEKYRLATKKRTAKSKGLRTKLFSDEFKM